jgi:hypothetical protein
MSYAPHAPLSFKVPTDPVPITADGKVPPAAAPYTPFQPSQNAPDFGALDKQSSDAFAQTDGGKQKHQRAAFVVGLGAFVLSKFGLDQDTSQSLILSLIAGGGTYYYLQKQGSHSETTYY